MPIHIHQVAELAPRVLLPGDPATAMALAQTLLGDDRLMFNHNRGLWGYSGTAKDGELLTIQSTGLGGPSAAIVLEELAQLGALIAIRVGTCAPIAAGLVAGELIAADAVISADGVSRALGAPARAELDQPLSDALAGNADHRGTIVTRDLFYDPESDANFARWRAQRALAVDLQTAALAAVAARREIVFGCLLSVEVDARADEATRQDQLDAATARLGQTAVDAILDHRKPKPEPRPDL